MYGKHPGFLTAREEQCGVDRAIDGTPLPRPSQSPRAFAPQARVWRAPDALAACHGAPSRRPARVTLYSR